MKMRPILFSGAMVRAILEGRKTQTRRGVKPQPGYVLDSVCGAYEPAVVGRDGEVFPGREVFGFYNDEGGWVCPYGRPGEGLWVREAYFQRGFWERVPGVMTRSGRREKWRFVPVGEVCFDRPAGEVRKGRHAADPETVAWHERRARFMPRAASRMSLVVVSVRVERLQDITEGDAMAEGIERVMMPTGEVMFPDYLEAGCLLARPVSCYATLWEKIHGVGSYSLNPWVWVVEFRRVEGGGL